MNLHKAEDIKQELAANGIAISNWAKQRGFSPGLVHQVLSGRLKCVRGQAHDIAVVLGLKPGVVGNINTLSFENNKEGESGENDH